jgi:hypothetical protein
MEKTNKIIMMVSTYWIVCLITFASLTIHFYDNDVTEIRQQYQELLDETRFDERCPMYNMKGNFERIENSNVNGLYFVGTDYYCVWTKDRSFDEVEETDRHEYCHWLVDKQFEHFCEED